MNVYRIEVPVWATAYVMADTPEEATARLLAQDMSVLGIGAESLLDEEIRFSDVATIYTTSEFGEAIPQEPELCDDEEHPFPEADA